MSINQRLDLKQSQSLVMTPQLQQSIKLLQLSMMELSTYVEEELEKNPFLEEDGESGENNSQEQSTDNAESDDKNSETTLYENSQDAHKKDNPLIDGDDSSNIWDDGAVSTAVYEGNETLTYERVSKNSSTSYGDSGENALEQIAAGEISLRDHLIDQINIAFDAPSERLIALYLMEQLDESGYLHIDEKEVKSLLKCDVKALRAVIDVLQGFDPAGIFARSLSECLALQLKDRNHFDPAIEVLLKNLETLADGNLKALQKRCDVSEEDIQHMIREIRTLNPKPALGFSNDVVQVMLPDVFLRRTPDNTWVVEVNSEALPKLLVNRRYYAEVDASVKDKESKNFLTEQMNTANWLVKALDQRANTILKIATEIVAQQDQFLHQGIQYLKPLILSDIAEKIEMHESTVSRVINGKFMATHIGVFELKYFFSSSVPSQHDGEAVSSKTVKHLIKELINEESTQKPLSDDKLVALLQEKGVNVARRTVMKYRESMNIGSSVQRRKEKRLNS